MPRPDPLSPEARREGLAALPGWTPVEGRDAIACTFTFRNFSQAFGFMTRVALAAERLDHHPEWSNVWNRVEICLTTHSARGLTELDLALARRIDRIAAEIAEPNIPS